MQKFGGDDIDRMLEAGSYQNSHSYNAVPPPMNQSNQYFNRYGGDRSNRGRNARGGRGRHRDTNQRDHRPDRSRDRNRRSLSPPSRHLSREEEERRRRTREQQDIERDQRTVFACQIHPKCDERDIFGFFSEIGKVVDVQLIRDNRTFKSKGLCYVEFFDKSSVAQALSLSGHSLGGFPVSVQLTQAEKNRAAQQLQQVSQQSRPMKLYVSSIHLKVTEEDIRPVFSAFGEILSLEIKTDHRHKSKGYGFVEFKKEIDAIGAMQQLNDLEILGQKIKVTAADVSMNAKSGDMRDSHDTITSTNVKISQESGNGGLSLSTHERMALMQKLGRGTVKTGSNIKGQGSVTQLPAHIQTPNAYSSFNNNNRSTCVLLSNMFNPATETDPDFDLEIREDVREEVAKFGPVQHIYVDKTAADGRVFIKFEDMNQATKTINNLNGRWFAKNQIKASYYEEKVYNQQFNL